MKKKILSLLLIVLLVFTLTACDMFSGLNSGNGTQTGEVNLDDVFLNVEAQINTKDALENNITLPSSFGSVNITWTSSNTSIIDNTGRIVARPEADTEVILNCTLTSAKESKTYKVKVIIKAKEADPVKVLAHLPADLQGTYAGDGVTVVVSESSVTITDPSGKVLTYEIYVDNNQYYIEENGLRVFCTFENNTVTNSHGTFTKENGQTTHDPVANLPENLQGTYKSGNITVIVSASSVVVMEEGNDQNNYVLYIDAANQYYVEEEGQKIVCTFGTDSVTNKFGTFVKDNGQQTSTFKTLAQVKAGETGSTYKVKAVVVATSNVSFLLQDESGLMLAYLGTKYAKDLAVGDEVELEGATTTYSGTVQFGDASTYTKVGTKSVNYPQARVLDSEAVASLATQSAPVIEFVKLNGKLAVSGNYINIEVEGTTVKGSLATSIDVSEFNGKKVIISGYYLYNTSNGRFVNIIATNIELDPDQGTVVPVENPTHAGTESDPYDAKDAIIVASKLNGNKNESTTDKFYITGTIIDDPTADYCNFSFQDGSSTILAYGLWNASGTKRFGSNRDIAELPVKKGDVVILYANIQNYNGNYEMINALLLYVNGVKQEGETVIVPTGNPVHAGTLADPYDAKDAILVASKLDATSNAMTKDKFYVTGTIADDPTADYCNFNFKDGDKNILVYGLATFDGSERYGTARQIAELPVKRGDVVVLCANIQNYSGKLELVNAWIVSINGEQVGPSQTDPVAKLPSVLQGTYKAGNITVEVSESSVVVKEEGHGEHNYVLYLDASGRYYVLEEGNKIICTFSDNAVTNDYGTFTKETTTQPQPEFLDYAELDDAFQGTYENEEYSVIVRTSSIKLSKKNSDEVSELDLCVDVNFAIYFNIGDTRIYCNFTKDTLTTDMGVFVRYEASDEEIIADVIDVLQKYNNYEVVMNPSLDEELNGCTITWVSTNEDVMTSAGFATLQAQDTSVKFNVTVSKNNASGTTEITFIVKKYDTIATLQTLGESEISGFNFFATKAIVVANYVDGFLLKDETGYMVVYNPGIENVPTLGAEYIVRGMLSYYSGVNEFATFFRYDATGEAITLEAPEFATLDAEMVSRLSKQMLITPVELKGTLTISSGKYINVSIADSTFTGSINGSVADYQQYDNKDIIVKGYLIGIKGNYAYILPLEIEEDENAQGLEISSIRDVLAGTVGARYAVQGIVVARNAQMIIVQDETGLISVYYGKDVDIANTFAIGAEVILTGATATHNNKVQFSSPAYEIGEVQDYTYPEAVIYEGQALDDLENEPNIKFVKVTGTLSVSSDDKYFNLVVEGASLQGSILYPLDASELKELNGKKITVEGYYAYTSGSTKKYASIVCTAYEEVEEDNPEEDCVTINEVLEGFVGLTYKIKGIVVARTAQIILVQDETNYIVAYFGKDVDIANTFELGAEVTLTGASSWYGGRVQLSKPTYTIGEVKEFTQPEAMVLDKEAFIALDNAVDDILFVKLTGKLVVTDDGFFNIIVGDATLQGSINYPLNAEELSPFNGKYICVEGYFVYVNGQDQRYANIICVAFEEAEAPDELAHLDEGVQGQYVCGDLLLSVSENKVEVVTPQDSMHYDLYVDIEGNIYILEDNEKVYPVFGEGTITYKDMVFTKDENPLPADKDNILEASVFTKTFEVNEDGTWTVTMAVIADAQYESPRFVLRDVVVFGLLGGVNDAELYQEESAILQDKSNLVIEEGNGTLTVKVTVPANLVAKYTSEYYAATAEDGTCFKGGLALDLYFEFYDGEEDYSPNNYGVEYLYNSSFFFRSFLDVVETTGDGSIEHPLTAADANAIAAYLPEGIWTKDEFYIEGTVVGEPNAKYGDLLLQNGETTFTVYGLYTNDGEYQYGTASGRVEEIPVHDGDKVLLLAQIYHYVNNSGVSTLETMRAKLIQVNDDAVTYEALPEYRMIEVTPLNGVKEGYVYYVEGYRNGQRYSGDFVEVENGIINCQVKYVCDSFRIFEYLQPEEGEEFSGYTRYTNVLGLDATECAFHGLDDLSATKSFAVNEDGSWTVTMILEASEAIANPSFEVLDVVAFGYQNGVWDNSLYLEETVLLNDKSNLTVESENGVLTVTITVAKELVAKYTSEYYYPDMDGTCYKGGIALDLYIKFFDGDIDISYDNNYFGAFYYFGSFLDVVETTGDGTADNPLTAADAYALAAYLPEGIWTNDEFYIEGTVASVDPAWCNLTFEVGENSFLVYGIATADGEYKYGTTPNKVQGIPVQVGDKVLLLAQVYHYVKEGVSTLETKDARLIQVNDEEVTYELVPENNAQAVHEGTEDDPLDAADAYLLASKLDASTKEKSAERYYIEAVVASAPTEDKCRFNLVDGENTVVVWELFKDANMTTKYGTAYQGDIPFGVGDTVVLYGYLQNYSGTMEVVNAYLVKYVPAQGE